jgi:hypothetical protein
MSDRGLKSLFPRLCSFGEAKKRSVKGLMVKAITERLILCLFKEAIALSVVVYGLHWDEKTHEY